MIKQAQLWTITTLTLLSFALLAQDKGAWRSASNTASSITGDLVFSNNKLVMNFSSFPLAQIRELKPAEVSAMFDVDAGNAGSGNLYRVSIPAARIFLHHNTLCGSEETQWVVTYAAGKNLRLALFSGPQMPVFTVEAISNSTNLCGTFAYAR